MKLVKSHSVLTFAIVIFSVLTLSACETVQTTQGGVVGVDRSQRMALSAQQLDQAAAKQYGELIAEEKKKNSVNRDPAQVARVRAISNRLIAQTPAFRSDAKAWQWEVNVLTSTEVNAWCMPGGKIAVYSGLIDKLKVTDDELAAVIGHEISHALREHARERASEKMVAGSVISIGSALLGVGSLGQQGAEYAYMGVIGLPNSREHEREADRIGVELAARAGYDPRAAITLWQKMGQVGGSAPPTFLSTHPSSADRISDLTAYAQRVMPLYLQTKSR